MDGWMDGQMDGWMDGWMNGWMDGCIYVRDGCMYYLLSVFSYYWVK